MVGRWPFRGPKIPPWVTDWRQRKRWTHLSICLTFFFLPCLCELQQEWKCLVGLLGRTLERPKQQQFLTYRAVLAYSSSRAVRTGTESQVKQPKNHGKDNHCAAWWFWRASCSHAGRGRKHTRRPEGVHCPCHVLVIETDSQQRYCFWWWDLPHTSADLWLGRKTNRRLTSDTWIAKSQLQLFQHPLLSAGDSRELYCWKIFGHTVDPRLCHLLGKPASS